MADPPFQASMDDAGERSATCSAPDHPVGTVAGTRLLVDMDRWCELGFIPEAGEPLGDLCMSLRLRATILPGGRSERSLVRWALAQQLIEEQAFPLQARLGVREIVDAGLIGMLDRIQDPGRPSGTPAILMTNPARLLRRRPGRFGRLARCLSGGAGWSPLASGRAEDTLSADRRRNEIVDLGGGWVEPSSGHRRRRNEVITLIFREPGETGRIDVRLVNAERVMRLRFRGIDDEAFETFWARWSSDSADGDEPSASETPDR